MVRSQFLDRLKELRPHLQALQSLSHYLEDAKHGISTKLRMIACKRGQIVECRHADESLKLTVLLTSAFRSNEVGRSVSCRRRWSLIPASVLHLLCLQEQQ